MNFEKPVPGLELKINDFVSHFLTIRFQRIPCIPRNLIKLSYVWLFFTLSKFSYLQVIFPVISPGMAVYNVFIVCMIGVPMALYGDSHQHDEVSFYVVTICIIFCTTLTLCLVFVPKVWLVSIIYFYQFASSL